MLKRGQSSIIRNVEGTNRRNPSYRLNSYNRGYIRDCHRNSSSGGGGEWGLGRAVFRTGVHNYGKKLANSYDLHHVRCCKSVLYTISIEANSVMKEQWQR